MRSLAAALVAALASVSPVRVEARPGVEIPEDRSLSVAQYVARGLPDLENEWSSDEKDRASRLLSKLAAEDPSLLPRHGSDRSGVVFERVLAESLTFGGLGGKQPSAPLPSYGFDPEVGVLFDRELVSIQRAIAEASLRVVHESVAAGREVDDWLQ